MKRRDFIKLGALWVPATAMGGVSYAPHRRKAFQVLAPAGGGGGASTWITNTPATSWRNNFEGCVGSLFTTDGSSRTVTHLGLYVKGGNTATITVRILDGTTVIATASFNQTGMPEGWNYISVSPAALAASTSFVISRSVGTGLSGDNWPEEWTVTTTGITSSLASAYSGGCGDEAGFISTSDGKMFAGVNFKYTTP